MFFLQIGASVMLLVVYSTFFPQNKNLVTPKKGPRRGNFRFGFKAQYVRMTQRYTVRILLRLNSELLLPFHVSGSHDTIDNRF